MRIRAIWYSDIENVDFDGTSLTVLYKEGGNRGASRLQVTMITGAELRNGPISSRVTILTRDGLRTHLGGLPKREARLLLQQLESALATRRNAGKQRLRQKTLKKVQAVRPEIERTHRMVEELRRGTKYIRHSETEPVMEAANALASRMEPEVRDELDRATRNRLLEIERMREPSEMEAAREQGNAAYVARESAALREQPGPGGQRLNQQQAEAVATDEDTTLVLAGAGTGKTSVIAAKIRHLIQDRATEPEGILTLAFNRDAAQEIRARMSGEEAQPEVHTFHAFARNVVAQVTGQAPAISRMAEDENSLQRAMDELLEQVALDPEHAADVIALATHGYMEFVSPLEFATEQEYLGYCAKGENLTLNGERVRSQQEVAVANLLTREGIRYEYEPEYEHPIRDGEHGQYRPDFRLTESGVYLEHFALDQQGRAPAGWEGYAEATAWKRETHQAHGTLLLESHSWEYQEGELQSNLTRRLAEAGIGSSPVPAEELVEKLSKFRLRRLSYLLSAFLNHAKSSGATPYELSLASSGQRDQGRAAHFLRVFNRVRTLYEEALAREGAKDFHDLINEAARYINNGHWENTYSHVLVDEFQDISKGRMNLVRALGKPRLAYFLVGDDWQSIYRFAGSDVSLVHDCERYLGHVRRVDLTETFRFGEGIAGPSSGFIQKNPEQSQRELAAKEDAEPSSIRIIAEENPAEGVRRALAEILAQDGPRATVRVLDRYNAAAADMERETRGSGLTVEYSTIHRTKGLEADYVIVTGLRGDRSGFPSQMQDDPLLEMVMPPTQSGAYRYAEERRLFYVALTRARRSAYLVTDPERPSEFVRELREDNPGLEQRGNLSPACPSCGEGTLIPSQSRENLRCTNHPVCRHLWPKCPSCQAGYTGVAANGIAVCTNRACGNPAETCPRCQRGVLVLREGEDDQGFWGCSQYRDEPRCSYVDRGRTRRQRAGQAKQREQ